MSLKKIDILRKNGLAMMRIYQLRISLNSAEILLFEELYRLQEES